MRTPTATSRKPWLRFAVIVAFAFFALSMLAPTSSASDVATEMPPLSPQQQQLLQDLPPLTGADSADASTPGEKHTFQTEVSRLMHLIIHSLYKVKEIFLRELISNASDALDKQRVLALKQGSPSDEGSLNITVSADKERRVLIIRDTGIGMSKADLIKNLGTIARSGTAEFMKKLEQTTKDSNLIGQFGVGFYSAFLVADRVTVISKNDEDPDQWIWQSDAGGEFTVTKDQRGNTLGRGTAIILHMKPDAETYLGTERIERILRKYSEFIHFPIYLEKTKEETVEVPIEEEEERPADADEDAEKPAVDSDDEDVVTEDVNDAEEADKPKTRTETVKRLVQERMNPTQPLWQRDPKSVNATEYNDFYKSVFKESTEPMHSLHFKAEGEVEFKSVLFVPSEAPPMMLQNAENALKAIRLYVRRVFITDELLNFLPRYLGFLKGLVDSDDLPLNVSRESLQENRILRLIKRKVIQKALAMLKDMSADKAKYERFLKQFGAALKLGALEDEKNRKKLMTLLRFRTSNSTAGIVSLDEYIARMAPKQTQIYYMPGESLYEIKHSPFVERLKKLKLEVIYANEPIDEYLFDTVGVYGKYTFQHVGKDGLVIPGQRAEDEQAAIDEEYKPLADYFQEILGKQLERVNVSTRLTDSPCALVAPRHGWSGNMERLMNAHPTGASKLEKEMREKAQGHKKILELNPRHPVIKALLKKVQEEEMDEDMEEVVKVLYDTAVLRSGYGVKDLTAFASRIEDVVRQNLGVSLDEEVEEEPEKPAVEEKKEETEEGAAEEEQEQEEERKPVSEEVDFEDEDTIRESVHDEL